MKLQRALAVLGVQLLVACASDPKPDPHLSIDLTPQAQGPSSLAQALGQLDVPAIAEECGPAVVVIVGSSKQGSGVILAGNLVATNAHVVDAQTSLEITLRDGKKLPGELVIADSDMDLALIRLPPGKYATARMGDSNKLRAGEPVVAIGAPLGLEQTVSSGEVAALREVEGAQFIQISVPISHGSSGGGLFNKNGELIGITTASFTEGQNLNFAVPSMALKKLLAKASSK